MNFRLQIIFILLGTFFNLYGISQTCNSLKVKINLLLDSADAKTPLENYKDFKTLIEETENSIKNPEIPICFSQLSSLYRNLGIAEMNLNDFVLAEVSFRKSIALAKHVERKDYLGSSYNMLGEFYHNQSQLDSAKLYYELAYAEMQKAKKNYLNAQLFQNLAHIDLELHQLKSATNYTIRLKEYGQVENDQYAICSAKQLHILIEMEKFGASNTTFLNLRQCLTCFQKIEDTKSVLNIYENIGLAHEKTGNHDSAAMYYEMASLYADSLNSVYDLSYLNKSTSNLSKIIQAKNRWQTNWIYALVILITGLIGLIFIIFRLRKQKAIIQKQKLDQLIKQQEIQAMDAMLTGQDRERKRIAEELHDRIGGMLATIKIHYNNVEDQINILQTQVKSEYERTGNLIDATTEEVRRISHNLYSGILMKFGLKTALQELQEVYQTIQSPVFNWHFEQINRRFDSEIEINIYRVIQESISNTLKHAKANEITIQITDHQYELSVIIEDDGIGFDTTTIKRGIGLDNIRSRTSRIGAKLSIDSHPKTGTTVSLQIPIKND